MNFASLDFALFLPLVFGVYWALGPHRRKAQNLWLLLASYFFYAWWDVRFLALIVFSTVLDYWAGRWMEEGPGAHRKWALGISCVGNLGLLGFFKYYHFFLDNFIAAFSLLGREMEPSTLQIVLPVGISFYTFQTLSYTLDVYKGKMKSTRDWVAFAGFVSFFPQLVAGPIERAQKLLPQFQESREWNERGAVLGLQQILWGLFKKIVIADSCAVPVHFIFSNSQDLSGSTLFLGAFLFAFQIYGDFSGYSDMAIGTARLFGFQLSTNFAFPYFSRDVAEFWRRWHISLSTWFRDYIYLPLGGSRGPLVKRLGNVLLVFVVSGFWHGANWTFVVWGGLNALYFIPLFVFQKHKLHSNTVAEHRWLPNLRECLQMGFTFLLILVSWVFFRADNLGHAWQYLSKMLLLHLWTFPEMLGQGLVLGTLVMIFGFMVVEWLGRRCSFGLQGVLHGKPLGWRWAMYALLLFLILLFYPTENTPFIYFQF
jgi:alginate O-acetyltransferase complex protein AlgI